MRGDRMDAAARLALLKARTEAIVREHLHHVRPEGSPLGAWGYMTTRMVAAEIWRQERWLSRGGLDGVKPSRVRNDDFDTEYALVASFLDGLLSEDRAASDCAAALRTLVDPSMEEGLMDALEAHAVASGRIPAAGFICSGPDGPGRRDPAKGADDT